MLRSDRDYIAKNAARNRAVRRVRPGQQQRQPLPVADKPTPDALTPRPIAEPPEVQPWTC